MSSGSEQEMDGEAIAAVFTTSPGYRYMQQYPYSCNLAYILAEHSFPTCSIPGNGSCITVVIM